MSVHFSCSSCGLEIYYEQDFIINLYANCYKNPKHFQMIFSLGMFMNFSDLLLIFFLSFIILIIGITN